MAQTVTVNKYASRNTYGAITWSTVSTNYPCRREFGNHLTVDSDGHQLTATSVIYVGPTTAGVFPGLTPQDKITISSSSPRIVNVEILVDDLGAVHHEAVHCG